MSDQLQFPYQKYKVMYNSSKKGENL